MKYDPRKPKRGNRVGKTHKENKMKIKRREEEIESTITSLEKNVYLTVTIGNAQIGGNVINWKNSDFIIGKGEITNLNLGKGTDLVNKVLEITTNTLDVNPVSNGIVSTYYLQNTSTPSYTISDSVENHGDVFSLKITINFVR